MPSFLVLICLKRLISCGSLRKVFVPSYLKDGELNSLLKMAKLSILIFKMVKDPLFIRVMSITNS